MILDDAQLKVRLPSCATLPLEGFFYRAIRLESLYGFQRPLEKRYPPNPLYTIASWTYGARFTPRQNQNGINSLYFAETIQTAHDEANRALEFPDEPAEPTVILTLSVAIARMLDLTRSEILEALEMEAGDLRQEWEISQENGIAPTQRLGKCAFECGIQALRYASVQSPSGICYVLYPDNLESNKDSVQTMDRNGNLVANLP